LKISENPVNGIKDEITEEASLTVQEVRLPLVKIINQVSLAYLSRGMNENFTPNDIVSSIRYFAGYKPPEYFRNILP